MIKNHCIRNVLRELARCLAIFPNVHTLMIRLHHTMSTLALHKAINSCFRRHKSFPQIRSVLVPLDCTALLKYVPGVRYVRFVSARKYMGDVQFPDFATCCPLLENISLLVPSGFQVPSVYLFISLPTKFNGANACNSQLLTPSLVHQLPNVRELTLQFIYDIVGIWVCSSFLFSLYLNTQLPRYGISKADIDFILSNCRHLKIITMHRLVHINGNMWERCISQVKEALLRFQLNDKEEKIIVLCVHGQPKKIITLPWPPILTSL